jgi:hypothetical protein
MTVPEIAGTLAGLMLAPEGDARAIVFLTPQDRAYIRRAMSNELIGESYGV